MSAQMLGPVCRGWRLEITRLIFQQPGQGAEGRDSLSQPTQLNQKSPSEDFRNQPHRTVHEGNQHTGEDKNLTKVTQ